MPGLILKIGADVQEAVTGMKTVVAESKIAGKQVEKSFGKTTLPVTKGIKEAGDTVKRVTPQFTVLGKSIETLRAQSLARKSLITTLLPDRDFVKIRQYNIEIKQLETEIKRIQSLGTGGIAQSLGSVGTGASKAFSALRQAAFILPGIGIAGLIGGLSNLVIGLFETTEGLNSVERASISLNDELASMGRTLKSLGDDLQFLRDVAKLRNQLAGVEGGVLELLDLKKQEENDRALIAEIDGSIKILRDKQKQFLAAIDQLRQAGRIDISFDREGLIPEAFFKDENKKTQSFLSDFNSTTKELNKLNDELIKVSRNSSKTLLEIGVQENKNLEEANKKAEELGKKRLADYEKFITDTISKAKELSSFLEKRGILNIGAGFEIDSRKTRFENFEQAKQFISNAVSAKFGFLQVRTPLSIEFAQATIKTLDIQGIKFQILPTTDAGKLRKELEDSIKGMTPSIAIQINAQLQLGEDAAKEIQKVLDNINKTIQEAAVNVFSGLGESLGEALVGGDLKDGFRAFANIIAEGFSAIGKQMIAAAPIIAALKAAIKTLNPAILLPAGLALVAIGAALRGSIGKGITGFAGGGLVSGPTLGMIGEGAGTSRSNPEVIAPLDQLKSMLADLNVGNQRLQVAVTGRLRGRDMALQNARTSRTNRRLGA